MQNKVFSSKYFHSFLRLFDVLFSSLVVTPLVVIYWASTWILCDIFITPDYPAKSAAFSFVIGFTGQFILVFYQDSIAKVLKFESHKFINLLVSKVYALIAAQTSIHFWRGVWKFVDLSSPADITALAMNVVQNLLILMLSKTLINSLASPFVVITDQTNADYAITTYFKRVVKSFKKVEITKIT
jgi:Fuseless